MHYNGVSSYLFVNVIEIIKFKAIDFMIIPNNLYLGNVSKDFSESNKRRTVINLSVEYDWIDADNIKDIHKSLMKKYDIV